MEDSVTEASQLAAAVARGMTMSASRFGALFILPALAACGTVADPTEPEVGCTDEGGASVVAEF
jgi:hypothetical protein